VLLACSDTELAVPLCKGPASVSCSSGIPNIVESDSLDVGQVAALAAASIAAAFAARFSLRVLPVVTVVPTGPGKQPAEAATPSISTTKVLTEPEETS
jgi:hypothetical protein